MGMYEIWLYNKIYIIQVIFIINIIMGTYEI